MTGTDPTHVRTSAVVGLLLLATVTACGAKPVAAPPEAVVPTVTATVTVDPAPTPTPCPRTGLALSAENADAAMGLRAQTVYLTNCGKQPRTLTGYPALHLQDADHNRVKDVTIHHGISVTTGIPDPAPTRVTLKPGERAMTVLAWRNTVTDSTVVATNAAYLEFSLAADQPPQLIAALVDLGNTGKLDVTAWRRPPA